MKKKLESELISIAHRILKLKGKEDVEKMHGEVAQLYEKLTVLKFAQENFEEQMPTIGDDSSFFGMLDTAFNNKISDTIEVEDKVYVNMDEKEDDIVEPVMNKIKDMVSQMPEESLYAESFSEKVAAESATTVTFDNISSDFANLPDFEPLEDAQKREAENEKKSLNDKLKGQGLQIGLNDKLAFIKHLFEGNNEDYDRVISQINTLHSAEEAHQLVELVKTDYSWENKEDYETRFMEIIERKFN